MKTIYEAGNGKLIFNAPKTHNKTNKERKTVSSLQLSQYQFPSKDEQKRENQNHFSRQFTKSPEMSIIIFSYIVYFFLKRMIFNIQTDNVR